MDQCLHHKAQVWKTPALLAQGVGSALVVAGAAQGGQQSVAKGLPVVGERDGLNRCCPLWKATLLLEASTTMYCLPFHYLSQECRACFPMRAKYPGILRLYPRLWENLATGNSRVYFLVPKSAMAMSSGQLMKGAQGRGRAISECLIPHLSEVSDVEKWGAHIIHWKQECLNMFLGRK